MLAIQKALAELGLYAGRIDGQDGPQTKAAVRAFQRINGLGVDGIAGPATKAKLFPAALPERDFVPANDAPAAAKAWPRQAEVPAFYGAPGSAAATAGTCALPFPFLIAWNLNQRISSFKCHARVAAPMTAIFADAARHYGEARFRALRLDRFGGCYNNRPMRGGSRPSMHAFGIAVDLDPENNQLKWGRDRASFARPDYEAFWRIVEGHGAVSLGCVANFDWMHFQFARL